MGQKERLWRAFLDCSMELRGSSRSRCLDLNPASRTDDVLSDLFLASSYRAIDGMRGGGAALMSNSSTKGPTDYRRKQYQYFARPQFRSGFGGRHAGVLMNDSISAVSADNDSITASGRIHQVAFISFTCGRRPVSCLRNISTCVFLRSKYCNHL